MPVYSVIVPCYNEEPVLRETHKRLTAVLSAMDGDYEIVYVNDGSRDHTPDILNDLAAHNIQNRTVALIENGSWACKSGDLMQKFLDDEMKNMTVLNERLSLASSLLPDKAIELDKLADALVESLREKTEG